MRQTENVRINVLSKIDSFLDGGWRSCSESFTKVKKVIAKFRNPGLKVKTSTMKIENMYSR